jgi:methyl-accepting chemotaxis protein
MNLKLVHKFTALFMVMALIVAATGIFGIWKITVVGSRVQEMMKTRAAQEKMAVLMKVTVQESRVHVLDAAMVLSDMNAFEGYRGDYEAKRDRFRGYVDIFLKGNAKLGFDAAPPGSVLEQRVRAVQQSWYSYETVAEWVLSRKAGLLKNIRPGQINEAVKNSLMDEKLRDLTKNGIAAASDKIDEGIDDLLVTVGSLMTETKNEVSAIQRRAIIALIAVGISAIIVALLLGMLAASRIVIKPISGMKEAAEKIASGDLTYQLQITSKDELSSLGNAINAMAGNLKEMFIKIRDVTNNLSQVTANIVSSSQNVLIVADVQKTAIEETAGAIAEMNNSTSAVAVSAQSLSAAAVDTSSSMIQMERSIKSVAESSIVFESSAQETATSIEEMIANIKQITANLKQLSASSEEIASSASEVNTTVREIEHHATESVGLSETVLNDASKKGAPAALAAMAGIENIRRNVGSLSEVINALGKRSQDIGKILTIIANVAEKTNLLALNASILAAQAGEHGRPFAVVASEIKSLSEMTAASIKEITELIAAVQKDTRSSVQMAADGIQSVDTGLQLVSDVNEALQGIARSSTVSTEMSKAIQRSTSEESQVIKQITNAISEMSQQVEHISLALQEQGTGSNFIIDQTEKMKENSHNVMRAIGDQRDGSRHIVGAIQDVAQQSEQIAQATGMQKQKSSEIAQSMDKIQSTTDSLGLSSKSMSDAISALNENTMQLLAELDKFKV